MQPFSRAGLIAGGCACVLVAAPLRAQDTLTFVQRDSLDRGYRVVLSRPQPSSPWPAVTVYLLIDAAPDEAAAVFIDYDTHSVFIPSVKQSRISRVIDPATIEVDYVVSVPIVSDERYTVRNRVTADSTSGGYRVDWTLVRASSTKSTVGHARFLPHMNARTGQRGTLLEYYDFVTPGSRVASMGFIKKRAVREMEETAQAIARRVESLRSNEAAMRARVNALHALVARTSPGR